MTEMQFVFATSNTHKANELQSMLPDHISLVLQSELGITGPPEPAHSFVENALIKARHACHASGLPAIADDSGLCVDALDGAPGIISARYAGEQATDAENRKKLLSELSTIQQRNAVFYCVLVCLNTVEDPAPLIAMGQWRGRIATQETGLQGFGYDPVFVVPAFNKTAAELSSNEKNAISHRGIALGSLIQQINERYTA